MNILTNINTLSRDDLQNGNGGLDLDRLQRLRTDGVWSLGEVNMRPGFEFSSDELRQVHQRLGPGYVVAEDGCFTTINYTSVRSLAAYVNDYMSYYEEWFRDQFGITTETSPTLSGVRVEWVLVDLRVTRGITDVSQVTVSTRSYDGDYWRPNVDARLADSRISGVCIEMFPSEADFTAWRLNELVCKTLDSGKKCYLLLPPELNAPHSDYLVALRGLVNAVRQTGRLTDHRLYLVPSIYGTAGTTWFGSTNSVESAIDFLKQQPEWHAEWPITRAGASSELPDWPAAQLIDGFAWSAWSSKGSAVPVPDQPDHRETISYWWPQMRPFNYIRLRPRWDPGLARALCFPEDFAIYYSNGTDWVYITQAANYPTPGQDGWVTIDLGETRYADGIHIAATKLGSDSIGGYYFQLMEVTAGYSGTKNETETFETFTPNKPMKLTGPASRFFEK